MEKPICPKCGKPVPDFTTNMKGQLVGRCPDCKKWVTIASPKEEQPGTATGTATAEASQGGKRKAVASATRGGKPAAGAKSTSGGNGKQRPVRVGQRVPPQPQPAAVVRDTSIFGGIRRILNTKL